MEVAELKVIYLVVTLLFAGIIGEVSAQAIYEKIEVAGGVDIPTDFFESNA